MAFLNDISRRLSKGNQSDLKNPEIISSKEKMYNDLSAEESLCERLYSQIGRKYIELHPENYEEAFTELVKCVRRSEMKIKELKKELGIDTSKVVCPKCRAELPGGISFCSFCGNNLTSGNNARSTPRSVKGNEINKTDLLHKNEPVPSVNSKTSCDEKGDLKRCSCCGNLQDSALRFCTKCGERMANTNAIHRAETKEMPNDAQKINDTKRSCPGCGNVQDVSIRFCMKCGARMENRGVHKAEPQQKRMVGVSDKSPHINDNDDVNATVMLLTDVGVPRLVPYFIRKKTNEKIAISKPIFKIGRDQGVNDYAVVDNKFVGHFHCRVITRGEEYFLVDDNSKNHTFVDDEIIAPGKEFKLSHGQIVKLANEQFEFRIF